VLLEVVFGLFPELYVAFNNAVGLSPTIQHAPWTYSLEGVLFGELMLVLMSVILIAKGEK
jgi:hypothetical protein